MNELLQPQPFSPILNQKFAPFATVFELKKEPNVPKEPKPKPKITYIPDDYEHSMDFIEERLANARRVHERQGWTGYSGYTGPRYYPEGIVEGVYDTKKAVDWWMDNR